MVDARLLFQLWTASSGMWVRQPAKQESTWVSHRSASIDLRWHLMPMPINFPLQFCIDPNRMYQVSARALGSQMVLTGRHQAQTNCPYPAFCSRCLEASQEMPISRIKNTEKPEQANYEENCSTDFKVITPSSELYIYLSSHFQRTVTLLAFSNTLLAYPGPFTQSGFHPDLPLILTSAIRHLQFLHVSIRIALFVGEPRDCKSLQQTRVKL